jgi:hypothetical protein
VTAGNATCIGLVQDYVRSLVGQGFSRAVFLLNHPGHNFNAVDLALSELRLGAEVDFRLTRTSSLTESMLTVRTERRASPELSAMMAIRPDLVNWEAFRADGASETAPPRGNCMYYGSGNRLPDPLLRGVPVGVPGSSAELGRQFLDTCIAVAEHTAALILAVAKRLSGEPGAAARNRLGYSPVVTGASVYRYNWAGWSPVAVKDSRLGLVGFGRIGRRVASIAVALGMKVSYCCRHRLTPVDEAKSCVQYKSLPDLCAESDFISLHVPYSEETRGIIGSREFSLMRPGTVLINTSRGGVVDEAELVRALQSGRLGGAALDVFSVEPISEDHRLLRLENVLLTPHVAAGVLDMKQLAR